MAFIPDIFWYHETYTQVTFIIEFVTVFIFMLMVVLEVFFGRIPDFLVVVRIVAILEVVGGHKIEIGPHVNLTCVVRSKNLSSDNARLGSKSNK